MSIFDFLRFKKKEEKPYKYSNILHLWEDDYLMIELLPKENINFLKKETKRIDDFGKEHFDGFGFNEVTEISEISVKTIEKNIDFELVVNIFKNTDLARVTEIVQENIGYLSGDKVPVGFGSNKFAVILENKGEKLKHIWIAGLINDIKQINKLEKGLIEFCKMFNFLAVDWYKCQHYDLLLEKERAQFLDSIFLEI